MKHIFKLLLLAVFSICSVAFVSKFDKSDALIGSWKTGDGSAIIQIYKNGDKFQGKINWLKDPTDPDTGKAKLDKKHPEEKNHTRAIIGLVNLWGFTYTSENEWTGGKIYDPKNGKTYSCKITMDHANKLRVRGFIGLSLIGRTDVWARQ